MSSILHPRHFSIRGTLHRLIVKHFASTYLAWMLMHALTDMQKFFHRVLAHHKLGSTDTPYRHYHHTFIHHSASYTVKAWLNGAACLLTHKLLTTCVHVYCSHPFIYFPAFYSVKSLVERQPHPMEHAYNKWRNEIWDSCKALWCLWVPGQLLNFAVVPRYLRVPFGRPPPKLPMSSAMPHSQTSFSLTNS